MGQNGRFCQGVLDLDLDLIGRVISAQEHAIVGLGSAPARFFISLEKFERRTPLETSMVVDG